MYVHVYVYVYTPIKDIFKDKARREGDSVTDALSTMLQLLGEELEVAS